MESTARSMVTANLTKVLHSYGDLEVQETMRFANQRSAEAFHADMLNKRVKGLSGTSYTIIKFSF